MIVPAQTSATDRLVHLTWVTPRAEEQFKRLDSVDQAKITQALVRPVQLNHCKLVQGLAQCRVFRFRASDTLRVSYRTIAQGQCIVHIGRKEEFNSFARHYDGQVSTNLVPLQESVIMADHQPAGKKQATNNGSTHAGANSVQQNGTEDGRLLIELFSEMIRNAVNTQCEPIVSSRIAPLEEAQKELENRFHECARKTAQHDARLGGLANTYASKLADSAQEVEKLADGQQALATMVNQVRLDLDTRVAAQDHTIERLQADVARQALLATMVGNTVEVQVATLNDQMRQRTEEIDARLDTFQAMAATHAVTCQTQLSSLDGRIANGEQTLSSLDDTVRRLWATVHVQDETIADLQQKLSKLTAEVVALTTPAANASPWQRLTNWVRTLGLTLVRPAAHRP